MDCGKDSVGCLHSLFLTLYFSYYYGLPPSRHSILYLVIGYARIETLEVCDERGGNGDVRKEFQAFLYFYPFPINRIHEPIFAPTPSQSLLTNYKHIGSTICGRDKDWDGADVVFVL